MPVSTPDINTSPRNQDATRSHTFRDADMLSPDQEGATEECWKPQG